MQRICAADDCNEISYGYSQFCKRHYQMNYRNGHPLQTPVKSRELKPYKAALTKYLKLRARSDLEELLHRLWNELVYKAEVYQREVELGKPFIKHEREAYDVVLRLNTEVKFRRIMLTLLAMGYLFEVNPKRFKSERAFIFQTARRLRALTSSAYGSRYDHKTGKVKTIYRHNTPRMLQALWKLLAETKLPQYGMIIGKQDIEERSYWVPDTKTISEAIHNEGKPPVRKRPKAA